MQLTTLWRLVQRLHHNVNLADENQGQNDHNGINHPVTQFQAKKSFALLLVVLIIIFIEAHGILSSDSVGNWLLPKFAKLLLTIG